MLPQPFGMAPWTSPLKGMLGLQRLPAAICSSPSWPHTAHPLWQGLHFLTFLTLTMVYSAVLKKSSEDAE